MAQDVWVICKNCLEGKNISVISFEISSLLASLGEKIPKFELSTAKGLENNDISGACFVRGEDSTCGVIELDLPGGFGLTISSSCVVVSSGIRWLRFVKDVKERESSWALLSSIVKYFNSPHCYLLPDSGYSVAERAIDMVYNLEGFCEIEEHFRSHGTKFSLSEIVTLGSEQKCVFEW